jgi:hypothetical protein
MRIDDAVAYILIALPFVIGPLIWYSSRVSRIEIEKWTRQLREPSPQVRGEGTTNSRLTQPPTFELNCVHLFIFNETNLHISAKANTSENLILWIVCILRTVFENRTP